jgi:hypothetical protein
MASRDPRAARLLGLWTAVWLFVLLLAGLLWVGDLSLQWPVLAIPVGWVVVALRPRRTGRLPDDGDPMALRTRTDTVERPALRRPATEQEPRA